MATIVTRETGGTAKGSPLTNAELDNNFINLNTELGQKLPLSGGTITGTVTFPSSVSTRPKFPGGLLSLSTGDGDCDVWGISGDYYPSNTTVANAYGIQWSGTNNTLKFIGGGTAATLLSISLDTGTINSTGNIIATGTQYGGLSIGETPTNYDSWNRQLTLNGESHARITVKTATVRNGLYAHDSWYSDYGGTSGAAGQVGTYTNHNLVVITNASARAHWDTAGNYYAAASVRSPLFYDLNDTAYYLDPASTSNLNAVNINSLYLGRNEGAGRGISWYSSSYTAWATYMSPAATTGSGPAANITAPSGTYVTSWALRNFVENNAGYGWTWESGTSTGQPSVVAEIRASDGLARFNGGVYTPTFYDSDNTSYYADFAATGTSINTAGDIVSNSDRNLKENIEPITNAIAKIRLINGVTYNKIGETHRTAGVIAQDVEAAQPELVTQQGQYKSVAYGNMAGLFVEGIKEHDDTIESLKQEVAELKALVKQLLDTK